MMMEIGMKGPLVAALILMVPTAATAGPAGPAGKWRVADGTAHIQISQCGAAICGSIAWTDDGGGKDENNPNPAFRNRSLVGLPILRLEPSGQNLWTGSVYNAKNGQNYSAKLNLQSETVLRLEGCVPGTNLCGEENWTRMR
jgi:uncharacterized protein (DUF2147 family)